MVLEMKTFKMKSINFLLLSLLIVSIGIIKAENQCGLDEKWDGSWEGPNGVKFPPMPAGNRLNGLLLQLSKKDVRDCLKKSPQMAKATKELKEFQEAVSAIYKSPLIKSALSKGLKLWAATRDDIAKCNK